MMVANLIDMTIDDPMQTCMQSCFPSYIRTSLLETLRGRCGNLRQNARIADLYPGRELPSRGDLVDSAIAVMGAHCCSPSILVPIGEGLRVTQRRPGNQVRNSKDFFFFFANRILYPNTF